ncbi:MAG TPA: PAS domain-containing protein, partial [Aggregatilineales bacterium]|nr:PAS domain-containing protein [Aggregatilineales bacterium]
MNEHQLQIILHNINQGVLLINADGTVGTANSRLKSLLNVPPDRLTGKHFDELHDNPALNLSESFGFAGDGLFMLVQQLQAGVALESTIGYEIINAGRRRYIRRSHIPIYDKDDNVISLLMIFTDETEIHELRQMEDEITSMIVHDLRSPLSAVSSTVRLLRDSADP